MAVGGLAIPKHYLPDVLSGLKAIPNPHPRDEVKWQTTKPWNLESRKQYVDFLADLLAKRRAHFHIRFAPFRQYEHDGPRKRFDTVSKMYYQLLLHRPVKHYGDRYRISIRPDNGECTSELERFIEPLHNDGYLKYQTKRDCIADLKCTESRSEPFLQLLDVTLGALTAARNERNTSPHKTELAQHAQKALGIKDLTRNLDDGARLSVWNTIPARRGPRS